jgi:hypothetical protein
MTGSEADTERELDGDESDSADSVKLAKFLTPVPKPKSSFPPAPVPEIPKSSLPSTPERTSLFSDLPVPRRNSSLLPPPGVAEVSPAPAAPVAPVEPPPAIAPAADETSPEEFAPHESTTSDLTVEQDLEGEPRASEPDLDFLPHARPRSRRVDLRYAVIAVAALAVITLFVVIVRRLATPSRPPLVAAVPSATEPVPTGLPDEAPAPPPDNLDLAEPDVAAGRELRKEARRLLERGQADEGVALARRAIGADPNAPEAYILLAAGLQDLGRWQESRDVFAKCIAQPNGKANPDCVYFATRSK